MEGGHLIFKEYASVFSEITGNKPYNYQHIVTRKILAGENLILVAPTGCGKTWAAIVPFVFSLIKGEPVADRLIYVLPLRSLASSLYQSTSEALKKARIELDIRLQTGEQRDDPFFQGDIIFTTIDQALSGLLTIPVSLSPRLGNIVAGSFIGSYVVFDEVHLMEIGKSLATAVVLADRLNSVTRFLYMSATMPKSFLVELAGIIKASVMDLRKKDLNDIPTLHNKKRYFHREDQPMSPELVFMRHNKRSLVICNTVRRAQEMARGLNDLNTNKSLETQIILLHSRFLSDDRRHIERRLTALLGPPDKRLKEADVILVATQVVEAGLDISCENLHTEIAPANSVIQRAGRCARYVGENGTVWIYSLKEQNGRGNAQATPYDRELVISTGEELGKSKYKKSIDFELEKELLETVHGQKDLDSLRKIDWDSRRRDIRTAWRTEDYSFVRKLIRDVDSVMVLIHDEPERVDLRQRPEYLSIPRSTLLGWWSGIPEEKRNSAAKILLVTNNNESEFQWEWKSVNSETDLRSAPFLIALNPAFATYNRYYGLILTHGGEYRTGYQGASQVKEIYSYSYKRECFSEHVRRVLQALQSQRGQETARKRLSQLMALKLQTIKRLEKLTAVLHDTGKLTVLWQKAAADWQKDRNGTIDNVLLAHTDFDPYNQWDKEHYRNAAFIRPPHAIEGAIAVSRLVMDICNKWAGDEVGVLVTRAVLAAISCHHSSRARKLMKSYKYHPNSSAIMVDIMQQCGIHLKKWVPTLCPERTDINEFAEVIEQAVSGEGMFLYWHLVRSLRLADQRSFEVV